MFILTGTQIDRGIMQSLVCQKWTPGMVAVSGDYSAATDGISELATLAVMDEIARDDVIYQALYRGLGPHQLEYYGEDWSCKNGLDKTLLPNPVLQRRGQLMGSPLSFPILCALNLACFWASMEWFHNENFTYEDLSGLVRINGDDIGFVCEQEFYHFWRACLDDFGFTPSVGKNFVSRDFININSQYYEIRHTDDFSYVHREVPFVNMGLVTGRTKGDTMDDLGMEGPYADFLVARESSARIVEDLVRDLPEEYVLPTYNTWKEYHQYGSDASFPIGYHSGGLNTEIGPSTLSEAIFQHYTSSISRRKITMPWMGSAGNDKMGGYWKAFTVFPSEQETIREIDRAIHKSVSRRPRRFRTNIAPLSQEVTCEVLSWGSTWRELNPGWLWEI
jgi:hypothetical protein